MALRCFQRLILKRCVISATKPFCGILSIKPHKVIVLQNGNGIDYARLLSNPSGPPTAPDPASALWDVRNVRIIKYTDNAQVTSPMGFSFPQDALFVCGVDFNIPINRQAHHTDSFARSKLRNKLIVRRGQPFSIGITFSRPYDQQTDDVKVVFQTGSTPLTSNGTYVEFKLSDKNVKDDWGAKIVSQQNDIFDTHIFTPSNCMVAKWAFKIDVVITGAHEDIVYRYMYSNPIYILFNPWCKNDFVHMEKEALLNEYILNETGLIFNGTHNSISHTPWNYGQFESTVLDVAMILLDIAPMSLTSRGNPVAVGRHLSSIINSLDGGGVLEGRWDNNYSAGTAPMAWTGSVAILEEYWRTKTAVRYGQCWVFAGVLTTVFRALGIPARVVTNFESAHDTDGSITVDMEVNNNGDIIQENDSVWNFHVWTEIWMARPDLPPGYGGWQVVDATPQEQSRGVYCCGPTSVVAIQFGDVNLQYDGPFVFAEVNADKIYWLKNARGGMDCFKLDTTSIGQFISTKAPNTNDREDLTNNYKFAEGTQEERVAVEKAVLTGSTTKPVLYQPKASDIEFSIQQDSVNTWLGKDFVVGLKMKNKSRERRTVNCRIVVSSVYYNGTMGGNLKSERFNVWLPIQKETVQDIILKPEEYVGRLKDGLMVDVATFARVHGTGQSFIDKSNFRLRKPTLKVKAPNEVGMNEQFEVEISFTNPIHIPLTGCTITVDGMVMHSIFPHGDVQPHGVFSATPTVVPKKTGLGRGIIIFHSEELKGMNATFDLFVRDE